MDLYLKHKHKLGFVSKPVFWKKIDRNWEKDNLHIGHWSLVFEQGISFSLVLTRLISGNCLIFVQVAMKVEFPHLLENIPKRNVRGTGLSEKASNILGISVILQDSTFMNKLFDS